MLKKTLAATLFALTLALAVPPPTTSAATTAAVEKVDAAGSTYAWTAGC